MSIALTIGGTSYVSKLDQFSLQWETAKTGSPDMLSFRLDSVTSDNVVVAIDAEVIWSVGGVEKFRGRVIRKRVTVEAHDIIHWDIECQDYTRDLNKGELIAEIYSNMSVQDIITDLMSGIPDGGIHVNGVGYGQFAGFTMTHVSCTEMIDYLFLDHVPFMNVLKMLADRVGYDFYVDKDKDVHFFLPGTETAAISPTDTSGDMQRNTFELNEDGTEIMNSIRFEGGEYDASATDSDTFVATAGQTVFNLTGRLSSVTVTDNGVSKTVGVFGIHDAASFDCLHDFSGRQVIFTVGVTVGHTVVISGKQKLPVLLIADDPASIALYGTLAEFQKDASMKTLSSGLQYALAELGRYSQAQRSLKFDTLQTGLRAGQKIHVVHTELGLDDYFYVQKTTTRIFAGDQLMTSVECGKAAMIDAVGILARMINRQNQSATAEAVLRIYKLLAEVCSVADALAGQAENKSLTWVLGPYCPTNYADAKRQPALDWSSATLL